MMNRQNTFVRKAGLALVAVAATLIAAAETLTWSGGASGSLTDATWTSGGSTRAPQSGDRLAIPAGKTVTAGSGTATLLASLAGFDLNGTLLVDGLSAACALPNTFSLSGTGAFKVLNCASDVKVNGSNAGFSGAFVISNSVFTVGHNQALGTGPVSVYKGALGQTTDYFRVNASGTYSNSLYFDEGNGWFGFIVWTTQPVVWSGPITCTAASSGACPRFNSGTNGKLTLTGGMTSTKCRVDFNGNVWLSGDGVTYGTAENIFCDSGTLHIEAPIATSTKFLQSQANIVFEKANVLNGVVLNFGHKHAKIDLNGYSQTSASMTVLDQTGVESGVAVKPTLTSSTGPATLTLNGAATATIGASLEGQVSLTLDNAGASLTLTNFEGFCSSTVGDLTAKAGTLTLGSTAVFTALSSLKAEGGTLAVASGAKVNSDVMLAVTGAGQVSLASGVALKVAGITLNGTALPAGTYSQDNPGDLEGHISGAGSVEVVAPGGTPETIVWQGGDGNFSDANWLGEGESVPHAPVTGCRLSIPDGKVTVNASAASALARMKGVVLDGELVLSGLTQTFEQTTAFPLSGSGKLSVDTCSGGIRLTTDNSAFTGDFSFLKTKVYVDHVRALGISNKVTASYGTAWPTGSAAYFIVNVSGTFENELCIDGGGAYWAYEVDGGNQVTQAGQVTCMNTGSSCPRFTAVSPNTLTFTGGIVGKSGASSGRADFNGNVTLAGTDVTYCLPSYFFCDNGNLCVSAAIDPATYLDAQATISFGKANVVSGVRLHANKVGAFDLNGFDQTTDELSHPNEGTPVFTSAAKDATLTLNGTATGGNLGAALRGHLSFAFDNAGGSVTLTNSMSNPSTTDGKIIARAGTLRLGSTARISAASALRVENGTLAVDAGALVAATTRLEFIDGTGQLDLASGVSLRLDTLTLNGAFLPKGTYSAANPGELTGRITGAGEVVIVNSSGEITETTTFHWVGGHGTSLATAANWQENAAPKLKGADILFFGGESSSQPTVEGAVDVYGLVFSGASDFTLAAGAGASIRLGRGCFAVTNAAGSGMATFTVQAPVELQANIQDWSVGGNAVLKLPATLSAVSWINDASVIVTVNGQGSLDLGGDNAAFKPTWRFVDVAFVPVIRHSTAMGSSERTIEVRSVPNGKVALTNAVPLNIYDSYYSPASRHTFNTSKTYFDQRGKVTFMTNSRTGYLSLYGGTISGGIAAGPANVSGDAWFQSMSTSLPFRFEGEPITLPGVMTLDNQGEFALASVGNAWKAVRINKTVLVCENDNVLAPNGEVYFSMPNQGAIAQRDYGRVYGVLDLDGHSQTARMMKSLWNPNWDSDPARADCHAFVDSPTSASLTLTGAFTNDNVRCVFAGAAGLTFAGTGTMRFTKWLSTSTGTLAVQSGEFVLDANGGWGGTNAEVVVTGGQLTVAAGAAETAFGGAKSRVDLKLSGSGKIDLSDGITVDISRLFVDGSAVAPGIYGGASSSADKRYAAKFGTGSGVLRVLRPRGLCLIVR